MGESWALPSGGLAAKADQVAAGPAAPHVSKGSCACKCPGEPDTPPGAGRDGKPPDPCALLPTPSLLQRRGLTWRLARSFLAEGIAFANAKSLKCLKCVQDRKAKVTSVSQVLGNPIVNTDNTKNSIAIHGGHTR